MVIDMKVIGKIMEGQEKAYFTIKMVINMMVNGIMI